MAEYDAGPTGLRFWATYWPDHPDSKADEFFPTVEALLGFVEAHAREFRITESNRDLLAKGAFELDWHLIIKLEFPIPKPAMFLVDQPIFFLNLFSHVVHEVVHGLGLPMLEAANNFRVRTRVVNFVPITPMRDLRSNMIQKFVTLKGVVLRVSPIHEAAFSMMFECPKCGDLFRAKFPNGKYQPPGFCPSDNCNSRFVEPKRDLSVEAHDFQRIRIQEIVSSDEVGRIPRKLDIYLFDDLVESVIPGDVITVSGIVQTDKADTTASNSRQNMKLVYVLHLVANHVKLETAHFFDALRQRPNLFSLIIHSISPTIFGHEVVKAGLALVLFGGVTKPSMRGDAHILIVGDPGLGKSQMLRSVAVVAPRGIYISGNTSTSSGLTVTMVKDTGLSGNDYALEAGALVLADQGVCCVDELDKMAPQHAALLETMEQQSVSVAKAGLVCQLNARTSVVAAANPIGGHYDRSKTVNENLKMSPALLSRFDLIFILIDTPDERRDELLSKHVFRLHSSRATTKEDQKEMMTQHIALTNEQTQRSAWQNKREKQKVSSNLPGYTDSPARQRVTDRLGEKIESKDTIPPVLLQRYIAYARRWVHPRLTMEARRVIKEFYLDLRKRLDEQDTTPVTTRQMESIVRLAEARARMEMREIVTGADAADVIEIIYDVCADETGRVDFVRAKHGMSKAKQKKTFVKALEQHCKRKKSKDVSEAELMEIYSRAGLEGIGDVPFRLLIDQLKNDSILMQPSLKRFRLIGEM